MLSKIVSHGFVSIVVDPGRNLLFSGSDNAFFLGFDIGKAQIYDFFSSSRHMTRLQPDLVPGYHAE